MHVLIVKLSSLGDVVHAMPVVHDILVAHPEAVIDWVVEPAFAPLLRRVHGLNEVIECGLRRWVGAWWTVGVRAEWRAFRDRLQRHRYDAVIDLQGLTKSAMVARLAHGVSYGIANRTVGAGHEAPARWLVDHAITVEPRIHAIDRSREVSARALGYRPDGKPQYGLQALPRPRAAGWQPTLAFLHGSSRTTKLWPEAAWVALGRRVVDAGWRVALPHAGAVEHDRAGRMARALGDGAEVWPTMALDDLADRLAASDGAIGVDSGLSHIAVALYLPHVQLYNLPTAWRTGPLVSHGQRHHVAVERWPAPAVDTVWSAWTGVLDAAPR